MFLLLSSFLFYTSALLAILVAIVVSKLKYAQTYWKRRGFAEYPSKSLLFGSLDSLFKKKRSQMGVWCQNLYEIMKEKGHKHFGIYLLLGAPHCVPIDLELIKNIMSKDFSHFVDRGTYYNEKDDPISAHLFALDGSKWRNLRTKLTPTFTSGKMKTMFSTLTECGNILDGVVDKLYRNQKPLNIKQILGCFTTDIIGSCAFGLECKSFEETDSPFIKYGKSIFEENRLDQAKMAFVHTFSEFSRFLGIRFVKKDTSDFFMKLIRDTIDYRQKNNVSRKDFLQILIDLNKEDTDGSKTGQVLTFNEIVAQSYVFFIAGFETSSTTMTFALFELALNQDIQEKVRREVINVLKKYDGQITYEALNDMKYMNQVLDESLRKYPPLALLSRVCVKNYQIPDTDLVLEKNTRIFISVLGLHRDPEYFPNPDKFDPNRFSEENKSKIPNFAYIPFGEGPRNCIGLRFGIMQSKVGLAVLLKKYKFTISSQTKLPLEFSQNSFILRAEDDIWLNAEKI